MSHDPTSSDITFEDALARLERVVHDLEEGRLGLSESLKRYEEGIAYLNVCQDELAAAERKVELLSGFDAEGNPITKPLVDDATSLWVNGTQQITGYTGVAAGGVARRVNWGSGQSNSRGRGHFALVEWRIDLVQ